MRVVLEGLRRTGQVWEVRDPFLVSEGICYLGQGFGVLGLGKVREFDVRSGLLLVVSDRLALHLETGTVVEASGWERFCDLWVEEDVA